MRPPEEHLTLPRLNLHSIQRISLRTFVASVRRALLIVLTGASAAGRAVADNPHEREFDTVIKPMLRTYCHECHRADKAKGDLNLDELQDYAKVKANRKLWSGMRERIFAFEMPPEGKPAPDMDQRNKMMEWMRSIPGEELDCTQLASDRTQSFYQGHVMSRRLTRAEYNNTVRDLIGLDLKPGAALPDDGAGGEGFDATGDTLFTSSLALEKYLAAAEIITSAVLPEGDPAGLSPEIRAARERILCAQPDEKTPAREAAAAVLRRFCRLAFRRPVEAPEIERFLTLFDRRQQRGESWLSSLRLAIRGVLISPNFLFLPEPEPQGGGVQPLNGHALACRLSYFLWSTMPDEELFRLADSGELLKDEVLVAQTRRLMADPKSAAMGERFAVQWLDLDRLGTEVRPDSQRYPEFNDDLAASMRAEVVAYFNHLLRANRPLPELIRSDYSFLNESLAALYGVPDVKGSGLREVKFTDQQRGGLLGMAAVLASTSYPLRTSPVLRGKWLLDTLLGERVPPPPPDVPALNEEHAVTAATLRQQLEEHRKNPDCAGCHNRMDPLGFGLENYDVLGRFRTDAVDATGKLPSGESFTGLPGLQKVLTDRRDQILRHLMKKLSGYALGRELNHFDECILREAMKALHENEFRPAKAIEAIVLSKPFRFRYYTGN